MQLYRICAEAFWRITAARAPVSEVAAAGINPARRAVFRQFCRSGDARSGQLSAVTALCAEKLPAWPISVTRCAGQSVSGRIPTDWDNFPYPVSTQQLGSNWLHSQQNVLLELPSVTVPPGLGSILLFNASHPDAAQLRLQQVFHDIYNPRLFAGMGI